MKKLKISKNDLNNKKINTQKNLPLLFKKYLRINLKKIFKKINKINFSNNLVYAGGCALNSLANKKLYDSKLFKKIYIPYAPGDAGGAIGAALVVTKKLNKKTNLSNLKTPFIGPRYNNDEIKKYINDNKDLKNYKVRFFKDKKKSLERNSSMHS